MFLEIYKLGKRIYDLSNWREMHRFVVFMARVLLNFSAIGKLYNWFKDDEQRFSILEKNPFLIEQATRAFFYAGSRLEERVSLICNHIELLQSRFQSEWGKRLAAYDSCYKIWKSKEEDINWYAQLTMEPGQRKEGLLSVMMLLDGNPLYQIIFWLDKDKNGDASMWIGAMQGPNMEDARDIIKDITKRSYRYRTKNLILYMTMAVARALKVKHIYAVSNEGYYAMNHARRDRKLKTDFGEFWEEAGGHKTEDARFYEVPLIEPRKTMEEVPTRKRAVYRKRFAFQDDVDDQIGTNMKKILRG
ncbi:DUF535 family protein [Selenomonas ruminantium]|nr:DUF535 family protein [Selenomonas ruminantium]